MYLVKIVNPKVRHIWANSDTLCRQFSTAGLNHKNFGLVYESDLPICKMCDKKNHAKKGLKWKS